MCRVEVGFFYYTGIVKFIKRGKSSMKIIKVINNNTVCAADNKGREQIISGKGIGFGKKYGDSIEPAPDHKIYIITDSALRKKLIDSLSEIPFDVIKLTDELVKHITEELACKLNESLLITLSDHIAFAIERKKQGIEFTNPLMESISDCFPEELALGRYCLGEINEKLGVSLHNDEAGFIAMHIINARMGTKMSQVSDMTKLVNECAKIADEYYRNEIDKSTVAYERFLVHLKYLAKRLMESEELPNVISRDEDILSLVKLKFNKHYKCAKLFRDHIFKTCEKTISEDEMITLALHLKKITE